VLGRFRFQTYTDNDRPAVISPPDAVDMEQGLIQHTLPFTQRQVSDLEGLNLSVTVPENASSTSKLPVFVFVHGGGFFIGCGSWPEYDCSRLVKMAAEKGMPVIAVTFKYVVAISSSYTNANGSPIAIVSVLLAF